MMMITQMECRALYTGGSVKLACSPTQCCVISNAMQDGAPKEQRCTIKDTRCFMSPECAENTVR